MSECKNMIKVGDKVTVLPINELDSIKCDVSNSNVYGIDFRWYNAYVGKEYTVLDICEEEITSCELQGVDYYFPIDCLKLVK